MRKIVMFNRVTPEGYFAAADGNLGWVVPDAELDAAGVAGMSGTGAVLFGRRTYEMFASFWPHVLAEPDAAPDPHRPGHRSPQMRAMAEWLHDATKVVFSRTLGAATWHNTQVAGAFDPAYVERMKREPGKDIMIFGSGSIVSELTRHGLIDEYHFIVSPLLLGAGRPLFVGVPGGARLELRECKAYASGNVSLRYARID